MADWILVPCLVALRSEFNALAPGRDKGADGWIGDAAHQRESSDHNPDETGRTPYSDADSVNEVHALDIDRDLGGRLDLTVYVERIRLAHLNRRDDRLQNIIWRGRICSRSWGWTWRPYTGASQHFDHAHFSARYTSAQEADTRPWGILPAAQSEGDTMSAADAKTGFLDVLWDAAHAIRQDAVYKAANADGQQAMRNARDLLREVVGGPTDLGPLLAAVKAGDVDVNQLGTVIGETVTAGLVGQLDVGGLTAEQVSAIVQDGVRAVLRSGIDAAPAGS